MLPAQVPIRRQRSSIRRGSATFWKNCLDCHNEKAKGGLRLDSYAAIRKGGDDGTIIVPGDPNASMLIQAIRRSGDLKMPPKRALNPADVSDLEAWVKAGAVGDDAASSSSSSPVAPVVAAKTETAVAETGAPAAVDADFFENKVRPILANSCYDCHSDSASGGFRLDSKAAFEKGGQHGQEVIAGDPDKSRLIEAVQQTGPLKMPKGGKLKPDEVATLVAWVKSGAKWPDVASSPITSTTAATGTITDKQRNFWSFQPLKTVTPPAIRRQAFRACGRRTPIDNFILTGLHQAGLTPAPQTNRRTLIRRATYDMIGLPPTEEEVEAFVRDKSPNAWEKVVDRLLASPRYGERWGRHWLDVARYAEDDVRGLDPKGRGYMPFEGAYRYRDWVIKSFNEDLSYDRFLIMQLAGDRLTSKTSL